MNALISRLSNNLLVVYTNENVKLSRGIKYGYIENNVKYYFCTENGFKSLNLNFEFLKRNISQKELTNKLNELLTN